MKEKCFKVNSLANQWRKHPAGHAAHQEKEQTWKQNKKKSRTEQKSQSKAYGPKNSYMNGVLTTHS